MNRRIAQLWKFLTYDIWRITEDEVTRTTFSLLTVIKTIYLCINNFTKGYSYNYEKDKLMDFLDVDDIVENSE